MKKLLLLCLAVLLIGSAALAEDVYILTDVSDAVTQSTAGESLVTDCSYLRLETSLSGAAQVVVTGPKGKLIWQQSYPERSAFVSDDIYLPLTGDSTEYHVDLTVGDQAYSFLVLRIPKDYDESWNFWETDEPADDYTSEDTWEIVIQTPAVDEEPEEVYNPDDWVEEYDWDDWDEGD